MSLLSIPGPLRQERLWMWLSAFHGLTALLEFKAFVDVYARFAQGGHVYAQAHVGVCCLAMFVYMYVDMSSMSWRV